MTLGAILPILAHCNQREGQPAAVEHHPGQDDQFPRNRADRGAKRQIVEADDCGGVDGQFAVIGDCLDLQYP